ncbi:MAG: hypothetical protein KIS66_08860 [Fimbriimonadaceae bacterium]|nr:hypothetical protein [Fimbriimonadaceae bacterium]
MRFLPKLVSAAVLVGALSVAAVAQSPVGNWKGKLILNKAEVMAKVPKGQSPEQQKQIQAMVDSQFAALEKMAFNLNVNGNKSWRMVVKGLPDPANPTGAKKDHTSEGTWTQAGNKVTMTETKENGKAKPKTKDSTKTFTLTNANTMTLTESQGGMNIKIVFNRA